jgi:hypothetical protein
MQSSRVATPEPRLVGTQHRINAVAPSLVDCQPEIKAPTVTRCDWIGKGYQRAPGFSPTQQAAGVTAAIERAANFARLAERCSSIIKPGPS